MSILISALLPFVECQFIKIFRGTRLAGVGHDWSVLADARLENLVGRALGHLELEQYRNEPDPTLL